MSINFPNTPTEGQTFVVSPRLLYMYKNGVWQNITGCQTALPLNYIINASMQISQERTNVTNPITTGAYLCDQWGVEYVGLTGIQSSCTQLSPAPTPDGSPAIAGMYFGTAKSSYAAGDYFNFYQLLEGARVADFYYGASNATQSILRFSVVAPAGTYYVHLRNPTGYSRAWLGAFTIASGEAGTWQTRTLVIPGDTTGAWASDNTYGMVLGFNFGCGTTYGNGVAGWQAGNKLAAPGVGNAAAVVGWNVFVGDVGFYRDPFNTGIAPPWEAPDYAQSLWECQRYFEYMGVTAGATTTGGWPWYNWQFKAEKRITTPAFAIVQGAANGATYAPTIGGNLAFRQSGPASSAVDHRITCNAR